VEVEVARKLRLLFPGACYHLINRGNYRHGVFASAGAASSFEATLLETAARCGWQLHAFVVMRNHYHLAVTTPEPNLAAGMHWLQATFAGRFNRFRRVHGQLFQGRYKAILIEPGEALARVVDYIHLNPVRARSLPAAAILSHRWSSLRYFLNGEGRPRELEAVSWLRVHGRADDVDDWAWYHERLVRLGADPARQRREGLVELSDGWAIGTQGWRRAIAEEHAQHALQPELDASQVNELREQQWYRILEQSLREHGKTARDVASERKGVPWKIAIARRLRESGLAPNAWIAARLHMGNPRAVSAHLCRRGGKK
jgi:putative transposase